MHDPNPNLIDKFKHWAHGPDTELAAAKEPSITGALEAGLWAAYRAGYQQALRDTEAAQRVMGELRELQMKKG